MIAAYAYGFALLFAGQVVAQTTYWNGYGATTHNVLCDSGCTHKELAQIGAQSQAFDVPAVEVMRDSLACDKHEVVNGMNWCTHHIQESVIGCDFDKRRVLLTSGDNKHHCVLLEAKPQTGGSLDCYNAVINPVDSAGQPDGEWQAVRICREKN